MLKLADKTIMRLDEEASDEFFRLTCSAAANGLVAKRHVELRHLVDIFRTAASFIDILRLIFFFYALEIISQAGLNLLAGRIRPAGSTFLSINSRDDT